MSLSTFTAAAASPAINALALYKQANGEYSAVPLRAITPPPPSSA